MKRFKQKTNKAAKKRFKLTAKGKVKRYKAGRRHLLEHKSSKLVRSKRFATSVTKSDIQKIKSLLPGLAIKE